MPISKHRRKKGQAGSPPKKSKVCAKPVFSPQGPSGATPHDEVNARTIAAERKDRAEAFAPPNFIISTRLGDFCPPAMSGKSFEFKVRMRGYDDVMEPAVTVTGYVDKDRHGMTRVRVGVKDENGHPIYGRSTSIDGNHEEPCSFVNGVCKWCGTSRAIITAPSERSFAEARELLSARWGCDGSITCPCVLHRVATALDDARRGAMPAVPMPGLTADTTATAFRECTTCAAKPGAPILCADCLRRRDAAYRPTVCLRDAKRHLAEAMEEVDAAIADLRGS